MSSDTESCRETTGHMRGERCGAIHTWCCTLTSADPFLPDFSDSNEHAGSVDTALGFVVSFNGTGDFLEIFLLSFLPPVWIPF